VKVTGAGQQFDAIAPHLAGRGLASLAGRVWELPYAWAACDGTLDEPTGE
jgi:hypothetical protein